MPRTAVTHLISNVDKTAVTGVQLKNNEQLTANFVIDASSLGSRTPKWLSDLNYERPAESSVNIGLNYTSRLYEKPEHLPDWTALVIYPKAPQQNRMGYIFPVEGDRWLVTLASYLDDSKPTDEDSFLAFARSLPHPDVYNAIQTTKPVSGLTAYYTPKEIRRHYEKLTRFPDGLVVMGDAAQLVR
ncbi:hypothetical protein MNBD_CHLOROFLEXI01-3325 [hydrothermal vent metagenome]|uniref:Uncharacterized protein n=1 Tax=hydrothermal vent metagenome TaxID=652676 RepID=A0A3B0VWX2_9ZZZZ